MTKFIRKSIKIFLSLALLLVIINAGVMPVAYGKDDTTNPASGGDTTKPTTGGDTTNPTPPPAVSTISATLKNPIKTMTFAGFVGNIATGILQLGIPVAVIAIIYVGLLFIMARGNDKKIGEAKNALLYVVIGTAILLGAGVIATILKNTIGAIR